MGIGRLVNLTKLILGMLDGWLMFSDSRWYLSSSIQYLTENCLSFFWNKGIKFSWSKGINFDQRLHGFHWIIGTDINKQLINWNNKKPKGTKSLRRNVLTILSFFPYLTKAPFLFPLKT